jgi:hypothetical protein
MREEKSKRFTVRRVDSLSGGRLPEVEADLMDGEDETGFEDLLDYMDQVEDDFDEEVFVDEGSISIKGLINHLGRRLVGTHVGVIVDSDTDETLKNQSVLITRGGSIFFRELDVGFNRLVEAPRGNMDRCLFEELLSFIKERCGVETDLELNLLWGEIKYVPYLSDTWLVLDDGVYCYGVLSEGDLAVGGVEKFRLLDRALHIMIFYNKVAIC